jgi:hypothetical protein
MFLLRGANPSSFRLKKHLKPHSHGDSLRVPIATHPNIGFYLMSDHDLEFVVFDETVASAVQVVRILTVASSLAFNLLKGLGI